jgi:hypothetical protein
MYQANRRAEAARGGMCIECTTQPREQNSTRCAGGLERARDLMRIKRAVEVLDEQFVFSVASGSNGF